MVKNLIIASSTIAFLATAAFAADRSVALNKEIETLEPMKGIVFWPDQAKDQKDLQKSISLEFSYCLPCVARILVLPPLRRGEGQDRRQD